VIHTFDRFCLRMHKAAEKIFPACGKLDFNNRYITDDDEEHVSTAKMKGWLEELRERTRSK